MTLATVRWLAFASLFVSPLLAQESTAPEPKTAKEALQKYAPVEGTAKIGTVAEVKLGDGWLFLQSIQGRRFLKDIGNEDDPTVLGVAVPPDFLESSAFAVYSYEDDGHVADDEQPNYDELLEEMKASTAEGSKERRAHGRAGVELIGWAEPPHYDKVAHKLYWAKQLKFDDSDGLTLNYNVRILGRAGHLVVTGVGGIEQLPLVAEHNKKLLEVTNFISGQRYEDFDPSYDKVAAYGIGGLIAGKLALKVGLFAKLLVLLKVALKPILVGLVVIGGVIAKLFGRKKAGSDADPQPTA